MDPNASDFYDSLEDESDGKCSCDSLNLLKGFSRKNARTGRHWNHHEENNESTLCGGTVLGRSRRLRTDDFHGEIPLPNTKSDDMRNGSEGSDVDGSEDLVAKGLKSKDDGSFMKSLESESEHLPFVTREYRNLQFQKRKTYEFKSKAYKKKRETMTSLSGDGGKQTRSVGGAVEPTAKELKTIGNNSKGFINNNLTDTMKQMLLEKHGENSPEKVSEYLRRNRPEMIFFKDGSGYDAAAKALKSSDALKLPSVKSKSEATKCSAEEKSERRLRRRTSCSKEKPTKENERFAKNGSDITLYNVKSQLSYLEMHQIENGFQPRHLRYNVQRCLSDTNRSCFGDSEVGDLPEISSRVFSIQGITDRAEEESFYKSIIERDKRERMAMRHSTRSESHLQTHKTVNLPSPPNSCKHQKAVRRSRNDSKLVAIDIPVEISSSFTSSKKCCHYCSSNSAPALSKAELALKARAYGFMVNARNVFKLKNRAAAGRSSAAKSKNRCIRIPDEKSSEILSVKRGDSDRESGSRQLDFDKKKGKFVRNDHFSLPRLTMEKSHRKNFAAEILGEMRLCLDHDLHRQTLETDGA